MFNLPNPNYGKHVMFPYHETGDSSETSLAKMAFDFYINQYWPEFVDQDPGIVAMIFGVYEDKNSAELYHNLRTKLEEIRLRLVKDSIINDL